MALMALKPRSDLLSFRDDVNRIFDDFLGLKPYRIVLREGTWSPNVDIAEKNGEIIVKAELPGMTPEEVNVSITDNVLTLKGEKKQEQEIKEENYHRIERSYGGFRRSFTLPKDVQSDKIKADFKDGVLNINIPKAEEAKPKEIKINVE